MGNRPARLWCSVFYCRGANVEFVSSAAHFYSRIKVGCVQLVAGDHQPVSYYQC